jgi:2-polyprenyl-3-methyl-5-hydroxy-6-metoxy-1,4-benzoquinol methylase
MDKFLAHDDELGRRIQSSAAELYERLHAIDADSLGLPSHCLAYYKASHSQRLFFSIESSAHLLYRSISMCRARPEQLVLMDYGAGVGTLYLLAKMIGCKQVIYNDHLEDWKTSAELIANAIGVSIDLYIVGDIGASLTELERRNIRCDIVTSRNVVEHIYKLDEFYGAIHEKQPEALVYSSTTANKMNPASVLKHVLWHRKWEKVYRGKRATIIERLLPTISAEEKQRLAKATQGLGGDDLKAAIREFGKTKALPDPSIHRSNTCDPENGVWAEHLMSKDEYRRLINEEFYDVIFEAGFWDTHYSKSYKNTAGRMLNRIIARKGGVAMRMAPFIYVIARPRKSKPHE